MSTTIADIRDRIASVCAGEPFGFREAVQPFDFSRQPTGQIDEVFRLTVQAGAVIGGFNYSEDHTDHVTIWLARKQTATPVDGYRRLTLDVNSLRAAVTRDGLVYGGDYSVPDEGGAFEIKHDSGQEYAVLELTLPVNYEATL